MQDAKEEVRSRLNIEDVVGEYVELKRAGRNFKGLSPFSGEKTPSFYVSPDKNIWHDFSSNKGGDVFSFVMEVEGVDFRGSLELLARKAGVDLSQYESAGSRDLARRKKLLHDINDYAARYYQQSLIKNEHAIDYVFKKRALSREVVESFRIGYAPSSGDALITFLKKKGYRAKDLADAGVVNRFGQDLFRARMMVPLMDGGGQVIGFTARIIEDEPNAPKYLNTPQTLLYDKGRHVFGLSQAKEAIRTSDYAVIVEGNLDVVSSHQAGIRQVVATAGTAMTEHHLKALVRLTPNIRLAFDSDAAGLAATERAIPIAQQVGVELTIISLTNGAKDPDELIKKDPALWQQAIESAEPVIDWILRQYSLREDLSTAAGKRRFTTAALAIIRSLSDAVEREHYLEKTAQYIGTSLTALKEKLASVATPQKKTLRTVHSSGPVSTDASSYQDNLLALLVTYPVLRDLARAEHTTMLASDERQRLLSFLLGHPTVDLSGELPADLQSDDTYVKILLLKADARYVDWADQDRYLEAGRLVRQLQIEHKKQQKTQLTAELRRLEEEGDDVSAQRVRSELNTLIKEIASGEK